MKKIMKSSDSDWSQKRLQGIGGSDIGSVCGMNKYCTRQQLWDIKKGLVVQEPNLRMLFGTYVEPWIVDNIVKPKFEMLGQKVKHNTITFGSDENELFFCTPDAFILQGSRKLKMVQIKTSSAYQLWKTGIPDYVQLQCNWEMGVVKLGENELCLILGGNVESPKWFNLSFDPEMFQYQVQLANKFLESLKLNTNPYLDNEDTNGVLEDIF